MFRSQDKIPKKAKFQRKKSGVDTLVHGKVKTNKMHTNFLKSDKPTAQKSKNKPKSTAAPGAFSGAKINDKHKKVKFSTCF